MRCNHPPAGGGNLRFPKKTPNENAEKDDMPRQGPRRGRPGERPGDWPAAGPAVAISRKRNHNPPAVRKNRRRVKRAPSRSHDAILPRNGVSMRDQEPARRAPPGLRVVSASLGRRRPLPGKPALRRARRGTTGTKPVMPGVSGDCLPVAMGCAALQRKRSLSRTMTHQGVRHAAGGRRAWFHAAFGVRVVSASLGRRRPLPGKSALRRACCHETEQPGAVCGMSRPVRRTKNCAAHVAGAARGKRLIPRPGRRAAGAPRPF